MSTWVEVNGARIEKDFLDENIREARNYSWTESYIADLQNHVHCIICGMAIGPNSLGSTRLYQARGVYIDGYCYDRFLK